MTRTATPPGGTVIAASKPPREDDTGQHSVRMHAVLSSAGAVPAVEPSDVLELLADKVCRKIAVNGGPRLPPPPPKRFLGVTGGGWTKMVFGVVIVAMLAGGAWVLDTSRTVRAIDTQQEHHEAHGHDAANTAIQEIRTEQAVQSEQLKNIDKGIGEIKDKLK